MLCSMYVQFISSTLYRFNNSHNGIFIPHLPYYIIYHEMLVEDSMLDRNN